MNKTAHPIAGMTSTIALHPKPDVIEATIGSCRAEKISSSITVPCARSKLLWVKIADNRKLVIQVTDMTTQKRRDARTRFATEGRSELSLKARGDPPITTFKQISPGPSSLLRFTIRLRFRIQEAPRRTSAAGLGGDPLLPACTEEDCQHTLRICYAPQLQ